jgi:hypothetical protein
MDRMQVGSSSTRAQELLPIACCPMKDLECSGPVEDGAEQCETS